MITVSIVIYNNDLKILKKAIYSCLNTKLNLKLYLIDNSPNDSLRELNSDDKIIYIHNPSNPGFGAGHNIAFKKAKELGSKYHFVVNPDIYFTDKVIETMVDYMDKNIHVGMMMPQVLYPNDEIQYLPKLLPTPFSILRRKIKFPRIFHEQFLRKYELRYFPSNEIYNVPIISGCFTCFNMNAIQELGSYDDHFFMYFEDWDLSRRIHDKYLTLYFPLVSVYHEYARGAGKSKKLFYIFIKSAVYYFNKWGWLFDKECKKINKETLSQY